MSGTGEDGWSGTSSELTDVRRAPRVVAWSVLISDGIQAKGRGENPSYSTGVWRKTPRFVAWFVCLLVIEESKIDGSNSTGDQMKVPRVVAWTSKIELLVWLSEPKARSQKFAHNLSILDPHDRKGEEEENG